MTKKAVTPSALKDAAIKAVDEATAVVGRIPHADANGLSVVLGHLESASARLAGVDVQPDPKESDAE